MTLRFFKKKECNCIVYAIVCGIRYIQNTKMYELGGHNHYTLCDKCKKIEENDVDTLYDMWCNDNITDDFEYAGWKLSL